jgi:type VI secretion system protein VasG
VLDTACARLALGQNAMPAAIEDAMRTLDDYGVQTRVLERESALGADHRERLEQIAKNRADTEGRLSVMRERWEKEKSLVSRIREVRAKLEPAGAPPQTVSADGQSTAAQPAVDTAALRAELGKLNAELEAVQGETPLIRFRVDGDSSGQDVEG